MRMRAVFYLLLCGLLSAIYLKQVNLTTLLIAVLITVLAQGVDTLERFINVFAGAFSRFEEMMSEEDDNDDLCV